MKFYSGIGARDTPVTIQHKMRMVAARLAERDYVLRSGHARGADRSFEDGAGTKCQIFTADDDISEEAFELAAKFHPAWHKCDEGTRRLHARNGYIVLGRDLNTPSEFIVCWTETGGIIGGTGQALRIAEFYGIRVFNLYYPNAISLLKEHVKK